MRRSFIVSSVSLCLLLLAAPAMAQDKLEGRWEGKISSPQGERPATATFKKEGAGYTGAITGMRNDIALKEIKVEGDKVTAKAEVEAQGNAIVINYSFTLQGETLKGVGSLDFNGNAISLDIELKRGGGAATNRQEDGAANARQQRSTVDQPQQKQSIDYFVGQWSYKYVGRESALGPVPREGVVTFTKRGDGKSVEGAATGKHEGGAYKESFVISFDEASKALSFSEKLSSGVALTSRADWSSPISIRFTIDPVTVKGQKLQLRRTISVVAAHSFTVTEELSEDGGPFVRLGNAIYSKANAN